MGTAILTYSIITAFSYALRVYFLFCQVIINLFSFLKKKKN